MLKWQFSVFSAVLTVFAPSCLVQTMGHLDVIPFIAKGFNIYFPMLLIILSIFTLFRLGSRLQTCFGFQTFLLDDEMTTELIKQGKSYARLGKCVVCFLFGSSHRGSESTGTVPGWLKGI